MFIIVFFFFVMFSLDAVKNKKIVDTRIPKNNIRSIDSKNKIENKIILK